MQNQLSFSRDMEREADRVGFNLLDPAGFNPQGAASMFDELQQASRLNDNGGWPYLRSHPLTSERMADMQSRVPQGRGTPLRTTPEHRHDGRTRARAEPAGGRSPAPMGGGAHADRFCTAQPARKNRPTVRSRPGRAAAARQHERTALVASPGTADPRRPGRTPPARLAGAELALAAQQPELALQRLEPTNTDTEAARQRPQVLLRSQALLALGRNAEVADALQTWVAVHPLDAQAWQWLAQAWQAQQQPLRALRAQAEAQVAVRDYSAALDRLKAAQDMALRAGARADHIEASIIDTRLRAVAALAREQARQQ